MTSYLVLVLHVNKKAPNWYIYAIDHGFLRVISPLEHLIAYNAYHCTICLPLYYLWLSMYTAIMLIFMHIYAWIGAVHSDRLMQRVLWIRHPHRCCCPPSANVAACSKEMCAVPPTMAIHQQEVTTIRRTTSMISTWTIYSYYHKALQLVAACCSPRFLQAT